MWVDGAEDYVTYAKQLLADYDDVIKSGGSAAAGGSSVLSRLGAPAAAAAAAAPPAFNFAPAPGGGFGGFAPAANGAATAEDDDEGGDDDAEAAGPSLELDSSSADILVSQRVSLVSQDAVSKKWKDRGTGLLSVRAAKDAPDRPYIVFTTDAGRVLLNAPLAKGLRPITNPKAPKNLIMLLISRVSLDVPEERGLQMFKCDSVDAQKALAAKIEGLVPQ